ncbi:MarR family winged helix-turn-helix transcriptional regulator [Williamsia muralis]|nr:MarR family transcriptional regulator [Williamsia marianensis]
MFEIDLIDLADAIRPTMARVYLTIRRRSPFGEYTAAQGSTLATLAEHGPMRMGELARREGVRMPTVTAAVDVLVGHGLLRRDPDPDDRRAVQVSITDDGRREMAQLQSARNEVLARAMAGMTDDELRALRAAVPALRSLRAQLETLDESSALTTSDKE